MWSQQPTVWATALSGNLDAEGCIWKKSAVPIVLMSQA
jgi:hypothetical protein